MKKNGSKDSIQASRKTLARVLGCSLRTVGGYEAAGVVTPLRRGRGGRPSVYDLTATVPAVIRHLTASVATPRDIAEIKRRRAAADAGLRELRLARETELVVPIDVVKREAFTNNRIIREGLQNLPARLSAELAAESDPAKVYARLAAEIRQALTDVADNLAEAGHA